MKQSKRIVSLCLVFAIFLTLFPANSFADYDFAYPIDGGNIYYDPATGTILGCDDTVTDLVIPEKIYDVTVTAIGDEAFWNLWDLQSVELPDTLTTIGRNAFNDCRSLTELTIPDSVTSIGPGAFAFCRSLETIKLSENLKSIEASLFYRCYALKEIEIPGSVTEINVEAFETCGSLKRVVIPGNVQKINDAAFQNCTNLSQVIICDGVTEISNYAFEDCTALRVLSIPASVTTIGVMPFWDCECLYYIYYGGSEEQWKEIGNYRYNQKNDRAFSGANIYFNSPAPTIPKPIPKTGTAYTTQQTISIDGNPITLNTYALKDENGYPANYVRLRDVAKVLSGTYAQFNVMWDGTVNIDRGSQYQENGTEMTPPFSGNRSYQIAFADTFIDYKNAALDAIYLTDDKGGGYTYYKLRDLGMFLGFDVSWVSGIGITIDTDQPYTAD